MSEDFSRGFVAGLDAAVSATRATIQDLVDDTISPFQKEMMIRVQEGIVKGLAQAIQLIKEVDK